jgi:hypothetical protein
MNKMLSPFQSFWKLPSGFLDGKILPDGNSGCNIVESVGTGKIKPVKFGDSTIFVETGWKSVERELEPLQRVVDPNSGEVLAAAGRMGKDTLFLPFNLTTALETFHYERYTQTDRKSIVLDKARRLYYSLRPLIPRSVQIKFRQSIVPLQSKTSFPLWPLDFSHDDLSRDVLHLILQLSDSTSIPFIWYWPDNYSYAAVLTHDVETALGCKNIPRIAELEKKYGFRSLWNFVPERYKFDRQLIEDLKTEGFEIGVHGLNHDGHLFDSYSIFLDRAKKINHYLQNWESVGFRAPSALRKLDWISQHIEAQYDSSCPTAEVHAPQPGGCCSVFPFFAGSLVELPFTLPQDHTIFVILEGKDKGIWFDVSSQIIARNGLVNIVVHPDYIEENDNLAEYEKYLIWIRNQGQGWFALPREVAQWWRTRCNLELVYSDRGWGVVGVDADRARIAHASTESNGLEIT